MKVAYKNRFETAKKLYIISMFAGSVFITWIIFMLIILSQYKKTIKSYDTLKYTAIWKMDESCYTQFQNNMDKTLFLQLKFQK